MERLDCSVILLLVKWVEYICVCCILVVVGWLAGGVLLLVGLTSFLTLLGFDMIESVAEFHSLHTKCV